MSTMVDHNIIASEMADEYRRIFTERKRLKEALCVQSREFPGVEQAGLSFCVRRLAPLAVVLLGAAAAFRFDLTAVILCFTAAALGTVATLSWWSTQAKHRWITQRRRELSSRFFALENDAAHWVKSLEFIVHEAGMGDLISGATEAYQLVEKRRKRHGRDTDTGTMAAHSRAEMGKEDIDRLYLVSAEGSWTPMRVVDDGRTVQLIPR